MVDEIFISYSVLKKLKYSTVSYKTTPSVVIETNVYELSMPSLSPARFRYKWGYIEITQVGKYFLVTFK